MSFVQNNSKQTLRYGVTQQTIQRSYKPRAKENRFSGSFDTYTQLQTNVILSSKTPSRMVCDSNSCRLVSESVVPTCTGNSCSLRNDL